jgi:hypothetical protein
MADQITFIGEGGRITIEVSDYERETADNEDDANWLNSTIAIEASPFSGVFGVALTTHELGVLHERLQAALQSLSGTVVFQTTEEDLSLEFKFGGRGSVSISGVAQPHRSAAGTLHFRFESDQSSIGLAVQELSSALRHFPVRQAT